MDNLVNGQTCDTVSHQVVRHDNHSNVFQDTYLNARVKFNVQNVVQREPLQTPVLGILSHVDHWSATGNENQ